MYSSSICKFSSGFIFRETPLNCASPDSKDSSHIDPVGIHHHTRLQLKIIFLLSDPFILLYMQLVVVYNKYKIKTVATLVHIYTYTVLRFNQHLTIFYVNITMTHTYAVVYMPFVRLLTIWK